LTQTLIQRGHFHLLKFHDANVLFVNDNFAAVAVVLMWNFFLKILNLILVEYKNCHRLIGCFLPKKEKKKYFLPKKGHFIPSKGPNIFLIKSISLCPESRKCSDIKTPKITKYQKGDISSQF